MLKISPNNSGLFSDLADMLNQSHPLYKLANKIDWQKFEAAFSPGSFKD